MNWNHYLNFLAAMLAIVNPIAILPFWSQLTDDLNSQSRRKTALWVVGTSFLILLVFLFGGKYILNFFSISIPVFRIAGGIMLLFAGLAMIDGRGMHNEHKSNPDGNPKVAAKLRFREIVVPMAIPLLSGPGSITTVMLFGNKTLSVWDFIFFTLVLLLVMGTLLMVFVFSERIERKVDALVFNVMARLLGILVVAIAVQFIVKGIGESFPALMAGS